MTAWLTGPIPALAGGFLLSAALTPVVRTIARRTGRVAVPKQDRWHTRPTALLGGCGVYVATMTALAIGAGPGALMNPLALAATGMFVLGLIDDLLTLRPMTKLGGQLIAASFVVFFDFSLGWTGSELLDPLLTVVWLVGVTNAFNLLDNMDGLCSGIALIAGVTLLMTLGGDAALGAQVYYAAALSGALAGFLLYNSSPASIFLGDCGSLFVGFSLAGLALGEGPHRSGVFSTVAVPALLLLIPIFDTVLVTLARKLSGRAVSQGGTDHASHRLVALGFSERRAVFILYLLAAVSGAASIAVSRVYDAVPVVVALVLVVMVIIGVYLARVRVYQDQDFILLRKGKITPLFVQFTFRRRVFEVMLDFVLISVSYYAAYKLRFEGARFDTYRDVFAESLPIVLALKMLSLQLSGVYQGVWKYFSLLDANRFIRATLGGTLMSVLAMVFLYRFDRFSRGVFVIDAMLLFILLVGARISFRMLDELASRSQKHGRRVVIYGAGDGGALLVRELFNNRKYGYRPVGFIDDDPSKKRRSIHGLPVFGGPDAVATVIAQKRCDLIIISTVKLDDIRRATLKRLCAQAGMPLLAASFRLEPLDQAIDERDVPSDVRITG